MAYTITGLSSSLYCFKLGEVTNLKPADSSSGYGYSLSFQCFQYQNKTAILWDPLSTVDSSNVWLSRTVQQKNTISTFPLKLLFAYSSVF